MNKVHKKRLLNVVRALEEIEDPEEFDMRVSTHPCGTPACALGHYAARTDLQQSFKLNERGAIVNNNDITVWSDGEVAKHFGITCSDTLDLFDAFGCNDAQTPKQAIEFIRKFIEEKEKDNA